MIQKLRRWLGYGSGLSPGAQSQRPQEAMLRARFEDLLARAGSSTDKLQRLLLMRASAVLATLREFGEARSTGQTQIARRVGLGRAYQALADDRVKAAVGCLHWGDSVGAHEHQTAAVRNLAAAALYYR